MEAADQDFTLSIPRPRNNIQLWASRNKVPTVMFESGGGMTIADNIVSRGVEGIISIMRNLNMLDGQTRPRKPMHRFIDETGVFAPTGGFCHPIVTLGATVRKGQTVATISDVFGSKIAEVYANSDGVVFGVRIAPTVYEGVKIMNIGIA
jgi:predicted deacylase